MKYVLAIVFDARAVKWRLTDDKTTFVAATGAKLNYSDEVLTPDEFQILPASLLFEEGVKAHAVTKTSVGQEEILSFDGSSDLLASIFYVISLYDDYLQTEHDKHQRNIGRNALLHRFGLLEKLVVERWSNSLISQLEQASKCTLNALKLPFQYIPTFDIDHAYAYRLKTGWRKQLSTLRDILNSDNRRRKERREVLAGQIKDPFDTYDLIEELAEKHPVIVFWLLGDYGGYDKNISPNNKAFQELIQRVNQFAACGLHPSYKSNSLAPKIAREKERLEKIIQREVKQTRQHFLRVDLPKTYRTLEKLGFTDDYSLAYADQVGFRAGIARPFLWFDLLENRVSNLQIHPISYMDGTLNEYMKLSVAQAKEKIEQLRKEVETYGGEFIALWHNETIGNTGKWKEWNKLV